MSSDNQFSSKGDKGDIRIIERNRDSPNTKFECTSKSIELETKVEVRKLTAACQFE